MQNLFKLTTLAGALWLAGCSSFGHRPVELSTVEAQSQYDSQLQDALGVQKYAEADMLYQRRFNDFKGRLDELEHKRRELDAALLARGTENGVYEAPGSKTEAGRITEYQAAAKAAQARVAEVSSKAAIEQALIENRRDKELLEIESRSANEIADIERRFAQDLSQQEDRINQDIEGRRSIDAVAQLAEAKRSEDQRISLVIANTELERHAKDKLEAEQAVLQKLQGEAANHVAVDEARIADLKRQIADIEARLSKTRHDDAVLISGQESKVLAAQLEVERLGKVTADLRSNSVPAAAGLAANTDYVQVKNMELSRARAALDSRKAQEIASVNTRAAQEKNSIISRARTEVAALSANAEMGKAAIVSPVVTGRAVYSGDETPSSASARVVPTPTKIVTVTAPRPAAAPMLTIKRFEPKAASSNPSTRDSDLPNVLVASPSLVSPVGATNLAPLVVAPKNRSVYDVFYVYQDEGSWKKFQDYLKAYGVTDFVAKHDNKNGQFFIYCGRYYDRDEAASRVAFLNRTTSTSNVQVKETSVPR